MTKAQKAEKAEAIAQLREWIKPGDTVYTILDHVSRSGMSRQIRVVLLDCEDGKAIDRHPNWAIGKALGLSHGKRNGRELNSLTVGGCGMDMGFHLVYSLSSVLYGSLRCENCHKYPSGEYRTIIDAEFKADYNNLYPSCEYCGGALVGGYRCLGKGKCPSNYHVNHRDRIRCEGTRVYNPDGPDTGRHCYTPGGLFSRHEVPDGWPRRKVDIGDGQTVDAGPLACLHWGASEIAEIPIGTKDLTILSDGSAVQVCPTCKGIGDLPNPKGPERFDLIHTDGYALRHKWL